MTKTLSKADIIRIVQSYYDAVDARDAARLAQLYLPGDSSTLQFNADAPITTPEVIKEFTAKFNQAVASIRHLNIEIWVQPLLGDVVPVDLPPGRPESTITVVSTALPTYTFRPGPNAEVLALPATSIFTIDTETEKFVSVHNMFDIAKVYSAIAAVSGQS